MFPKLVLGTTNCYICGGPAPTSTRICDLCDSIDDIEPIMTRKGRKVYRIEDADSVLTSAKEKLDREKKFKQKQKQSYNEG
jgi:hypothetical protein